MHREASQCSTLHNVHSHSTVYKFIPLSNAHWPPMHRHAPQHKNTFHEHKQSQNTPMYSAPTHIHTFYPTTKAFYNVPLNVAISLRIPGDPYNIYTFPIANMVPQWLTELLHNLQTSSMKYRSRQQYPDSFHKAQRHVIVQGLDSQQGNIPFKILL